MKLFPLTLTASLAVPAFAGVTSLPVAPAGFSWQLVASSQTDSVAVDVSGVESALETALGISGSASSPFTGSASGSETAVLPAFGSPEPGSYSLGDTVDLVTSNVFSANLNISSTAGVQNGGGTLLVENKLTNVAVSSVVGSGPSDLDVQSALSADDLILVTPNATANSAVSDSLGFVQGELIDFIFSAESELAVSEPFVVLGNTHSFFNSPTVGASLQRNTIFDTYELVPEPSTASLALLAGLAFVGRRRRG